MSVCLSMWHFPCWVWLSGRKGVAVLSRIPPHGQPVAYSCKCPWICRVVSYAGPGKSIGPPGRRAGSGSWLCPGQLNEPGRDPSPPLALLTHLQEGHLYLMVSRAAAGSSSRDHLFQSRLWPRCRQLAAQTQFISSICISYHFLQSRYFSAARCSVGPTVLSSWMGGHGRFAPFLRGQKIWLKYRKRGLAVWD